MPEVSGEKRGAPSVRLLVRIMEDDQAVVARRALASSAAASLPRMNARRIGLITNSAISAAVALSATAITNTACQPYRAAARLASGTSSEAVPLAVYSMPLLVVAYLTPNVSPLVAGNRL